MTIIHLVRHGETDWNRRGLLQGHENPSLNERGLHQARAAGLALKHLPLQAIYASDLSRAVDTAIEIARRTGARVIKTHHLREQDLGEWQGKAWAEIRDRWPEEVVARRRAGLSFSPPGGETRRQVLHRARRVLEYMNKTHPGTELAMVAHGGTLKLLLYEILGLPFAAPLGFTLSNGGITTIERDGDRWRVVSLNQMRHLTNGATPTQARERATADAGADSTADTIGA